MGFTQVTARGVNIKSLVTNVKVKVTIEQATKAQRLSSRIALLFL